jgi:hypothetical protein
MPGGGTLGFTIRLWKELCRNQRGGVGPLKNRTRAEAANVCICRLCPSFYECGEILAFCMPDGGKSICITSEVGCVCPGCPVQQTMGFSHEYYCTRGNDQEQAGKTGGGVET